MYISPKILILTALIIVIALSAGFYLKYKNAQDFIQQEVKKEEIKQDIQAEKQKLQAVFDIYLNDFRKEVRDEMHQYKKTRALLNDIISPQSFKDKKYAKENYTLFMEIIKPALFNKINNLITIFDTYRTRLKNDLETSNYESLDIFAAEWSEDTDIYIEQFTSLFAKEETVISAYEELITFYYSHSNRYKIMEPANTFYFDSDEDFDKHKMLQKKLRSAINDLANTDFDTNKN